MKHLQVLLKDSDPSIRTKTCELLYLLMSHRIGRYRSSIRTRSQLYYSIYQ